MYFYGYVKQLSFRKYRVKANNVSFVDVRKNKIPIENSTPNNGHLHCLIYMRANYWKVPTFPSTMINVSRSWTIVLAVGKFIN